MSQIRLPALTSALGMFAASIAYAAAATDEIPATQFQGLDIFRLECATDPEIRPDGRVIAYARRNYDLLTDRARTSVWLVDVDTGAQSPLLAGASSYQSPRWSPDGTRLAYVAVGDGGHAQLMVRWMQTGTDARIADLVEAPSSIAWSPDGHAIAFELFKAIEKPKLGEAPQKPEGAKWADPLELVTDVDYRSDEEGYLKPGYSHLYVVSSDGGAPRELTSGPYDESGPIAWTRDGNALIVSGNRHDGWRLDPQASALYEVRVNEHAITELTDRAGPHVGPRVSPDGRKIAYLGFEDRRRGYENAKLTVMDIDGKNRKSLTDALDRSVDDARWDANGRSIVIQYTDHGVTKIARVSLDGRIEVLASGLSGAGLDRPYTGGEFTVSDSGIVAYTSGTAQEPADVSVFRAGHVRRLTHLNADLLKEKRIADARPLPVISAFDQRPIDAWLVMPPNAEHGKRYPLILEIHGGPYASYGPVFSTDDQLYAAAGYAVVYANPRGSTSYGEQFANLISHDYPSHDYDDLMSVVDAAIGTGQIDADQLYVTGGSGGGVLTAWIVGRTNRFRAAAVQKPVINWAAWMLTTDMYPYAAKYWFEKPPWEDPDSYWKHSPLSLVGAVTTPTLLVVGDRDYRTPPSDAEQYYQALQLRGVPTALLKVPGASHESIASRPSQSAAKASAIIAWFERYKSTPR